MNKPKGWYNTVLEINKELELRKQGKDFHPLDILLSEQTKILIQLFNECEFVGFPKADPEAETIVSKVLVSVQNSLTEKMDFVPDNPFFNLYLGLCYLEKVLQLIKNEYESNLNTSIEYLENIIYQSEDYKNLVEVSRSIGRNIINNKQHPDFGILKKHIAEQLEYIERNNKTVKALPPQQTKTETEQEIQTFTNNFDNIKPTEIYKHFKAGLVEKGYLTEQELNEYLKAAFELKTKPETLFKLKHTPTKQKIYTVFYIYYKDISQKKHERQKEYAALLGDFFEGYKTETIQTNWAREYKTKR